MEDEQGFRIEPRGLKRGQVEVYNELKEREAELTHEREARLKDIEAKVEEAKSEVAENENMAREVSD